MALSTIKTASIADNAITANKIINDGNLGVRNLIINGAMQVWQRGTSQTTSGGYGADRFWMSNATSASRSTDVPSGFIYSTKLTYSASVMSIGQPIELSATGNSSPMVSGESVTLSFYAKVDSGTEAFTAGINFRDSKFSATNQSSFTAIGGSGFTATTSWQRFTKTYTVPSVNGTNVLAGLEIGNIDKDFYITGVQLEVGETATPFEHRIFGDELQRCMRYYEKSHLDCQYFMNGSSGAQVQRQTNYFQVQKRASATLTQTVDHADGSATVGNVGGNIDGITHSFSGSDNQRVAFSWTADAEL